MLNNKEEIKHMEIQSLQILKQYGSLYSSLEHNLIHLSIKLDKEYISLMEIIHKWIHHSDSLDLSKKEWSKIAIEIEGNYQNKEYMKCINQIQSFYLSNKDDYDFYNLKNILLHLEESIHSYIPLNKEFEDIGYKYDILYHNYPKYIKKI
jgi:hypothetical protein